MFVMMLFYGAVLSLGAKFIADGAEELLELFPDWSTVIGTQINQLTNIYK